MECFCIFLPQIAKKIQQLRMVSYNLKLWKSDSTIFYVLDKMLIILDFKMVQE